MDSVGRSTPNQHRIRLIPLMIALFCLAVIAAAFALSVQVLEGLPHIEDEMAYDWQARLIARGKLTVPTPPICPKCFLVPFVVDYEGQRFGKYPLGWPALLAFGHLPIASGLPYARNLINPILAGAAIWLTYRLVRKVLNEPTALLTAFLMAASPFVLMNSALLLSHAWALFLTLAFCLGWLDAFTTPNRLLPERAQRSLPALVAALALGMLALTRPMTAVAVAAPFALHGLYLLIRGPAAARLRLVMVGLIAGTLALLVFVWQFAVTGDPFLNPYTLWWPYDQAGFGPGHGLQPGGFQPVHGAANTLANLYSGADDLFGWMGLSYLFIPLGIIAIRRNLRALLVCAPLFTLIAAYFTYWMSATLVGPRYYYEGVYSAALLSAAGMVWLGRHLARLKIGLRSSTARTRAWVILPHLWRRPLLSLLVGAVSFLVVYNLAFYMPVRLRGLYGLYGVSRRCYRAFETPAARRLTPALVAVPVEDKWIEYGCMLDLTSPFFDSDYVLIVSAGFQKDAAIADTLPGRRLLYYYPKTGKLVEAVRGSGEIRE